jgi:hypothetical protein
MSKALLVFGELFYVFWQVIKDDFYCTVMYVGPGSNSSQYGFRFTSTATNKVETISACMIKRSYFETLIKSWSLVIVSQSITILLKNSLLMKINYLFSQKFLNRTHQNLANLTVTTMV